MVGGLRELGIGYRVVAAISVYGAVAHMRGTADFAAEERECRRLLSPGTRGTPPQASCRSLWICLPTYFVRVVDVKLHADATSDDVYVQVSLIPDQQFGDSDGVGSEVLLQHPLGIFCGSDGQLYVADFYNDKLHNLYGFRHSMSKVLITGEPPHDATGSFDFHIKGVVLTLNM
ncbi:hypothetical protein C2S52_002529 [Perilla frutescens var. hirtella]|nr:hypothetical protein C2S52_002529 [Perilla frutescens var. hirtella]